MVKMESMDNRAQEACRSEQKAEGARDLFSGSGLLDGWFTVHDGAYGQNEATMMLNTPI